MTDGGRRIGGNLRGRMAVQGCALETLESRRLMSVAVKGVASAKAAVAPVKTNLTATPAATLLITGGIQTYASLADTTVTMSGKSELHLTAAATPITNTTINLTGQDSWVFFDGIKPSVVNSMYLGQIKVNGATAAIGTNCRVVNYEMGTVVIPQAATFQPLTAYTGPNFTGTATTFGQYTIFNTTGELGVQYAATSSFKLKRGYMAVMAVNANGTGASKVFIAQDHDLDVSYMPTGMDNGVKFIRVVPWRWTSKKGASDLSPGTLNAQWFYNWGNDASLTNNLDSEYVPIRQQLYWPGLPDENEKNVTAVSGFNEPNNPVEDAYTTLGNGSVDNALAFYPQMEATGLRVGAPAVTDGGKSWLFEFMDKAIAQGIRIDYIPIHMYMANQSAASVKSWLQDVYDRYHKPMWVTEFNNGANWTGSAPANETVQANTIDSFIQMMDDTPFIERYAVYSRVEAIRQMTYDSNGALTPAGTKYYNNASPVAYQQEELTTTNGQGKSVAQLTLDGNTLDTSGYGNNGQAVGAPTYVAGQRGQAMQLNGTKDFVDLPQTAARGTAFTFAGWVNWDGGADWQRVFDFGTGTNAYLFFSPSGGGKLRFAIKNGGAEQIVETTAMTVGTWTHVAVTLGGGSAKLYVNGALAATNSAVTITPAQVAATQNYLGKSQYAADPLFKGRLDDIQIRDTALTQAQIQALMATANAAPQFTGSSINGGRASRGSAFAGTLAGQATDADNDAITYAKASGPAWLTINADGTMSGTPTAADTLPQDFVVNATDARGATTATTMSILFDEAYWRGNVSGAWTANTAGATNWSNDAAGSSDFGALPTITTDAYFAATGAGNLSGVTIGTDAAVRSLNVSTVSPVTISGTNKLFLGAGGINLAAGAGATTINTAGPLQLFTNQTWANNSSSNLLVSSAITGAFALTLNGSGTTTLGGNSTYAGGTILGSGGGAAVVRAIASNALGTGQISFDGTGNGSTARLELAGNVTLANAISLPQRNSGTVAIENVSGNNALGGAIGLTAGGGTATIQSDAGLLTLNGNVTSTSGSRTPTFAGAGNGVVNGVISDGAGNISVVKNGIGTWTLAGNNLYTGATVVNAGTLALGASDRIHNASALTLAGGTFATGGFNETIGALNLTENSTLDFGIGVSTLSLATAGTFTAGKTLTLKGYTPGVDHLFVGASNILTAAQLAQINFGFAGVTATQLPTGEIVTSAPVVVPAVGTIVMDDGSGQRSMVRSITVPFNTPVTLGTGAITLWRRSFTAGGSPTSIAFTRTANADNSAFTLTFGGAGITGGSLSDGVYDLQFNPAAITTTAGLSPDVPTTYTFKRLFGDADGDGGVSINDFNAFATVFGKADTDSGYTATFDFDVDVDPGISINDFNAFALRFGKSI